jgi:predicted kinase
VTRILLVAQETGGVGKSMLARGIAEAIPDAPIIEDRVDAEDSRIRPWNNQGE